MPERDPKSYTHPPTGEMVTRFDHCPCFVGQKNPLSIDPIYWFCKYAAFDLFNDRLPESGICKHPEEQKNRSVSR